MTDPAHTPGLPIPDVPTGSTRVNPPGRREITYRGGAYNAALERLLARLPRQAVDGEVAGHTTPLQRINVEVEDDWTIALLHAWAAVTEVLGFYHERLVNEGYLRTARQPLSVVQLARGTGYRPRPGLAATAYLALTVKPARGEVRVPRGTQVQSVPPPASGAGAFAGALPQVFETGSDLVARAEWNELYPAARGADTWDRALGRSTSRLRLLGQRTDLQKGDAVLIVADSGNQASGERAWRVVRVTGVDPDIARGLTWIEWQDDPRFPPAEGLPAALVNPRLFVLRPEAAVLGYTPTGLYYAAPGDGTLPVSRWLPGGIGLPAAPVHALLRVRSGAGGERLLAATDKDVFASDDGARTWQPAPTGIVARNVTALAQDGDGAVYAGTDDGKVFETRDGGDTWQATTPDTTLAPVRGLRKRFPALFSAPLPKTAIRSLHTFRAGRRAMLAAATDDGVFVSANHGETWQPANVYQPDVDRKTGRTQAVAWSVNTAGRGRRPALLAGTDGGVLPAKRPPGVWGLLLLSLVLIAAQRLYLVGWTPLVDRLLNAGNLALDFLKGIPGWLATLQQALVERWPFLQAGAQAVSSAVSKLFVPLQDLKLPESWDKIDLSGLKPDWLGKALSGPKGAPLVALAIDVALLLAVLGALVVAWLLIRRFVYNRPGRRIGGEPAPGASDGVAGLLAKVPGGAALAARLRTRPPVPVYALAVNGRGELVAGTATGIYLAAWPARPQSPAEGGQKLWQRLVDLPNALFFPGANRHWRRVNDALVARSLLLADDGHTLLAGGQPLGSSDDVPGEVWRSDDGGNTWTPVSDGLALREVSALLDTGTGWLAGGTPHDGKAEPLWSPFHLADRCIDLDTRGPRIEPASWLVVMEPPAAVASARPAPQPRLYQVQAADVAECRDAVRTGPYTRVTVEHNDGLAEFDRTRCRVLVEKQALEIYDDEPVWGNRIRLDCFVPGLAAGQRIFISGKRMRVRLATGAQAVSQAMPPQLHSSDGLLSIPVEAGVSYRLAAPPPPQAGAPPAGRFHLEDREGFSGWTEPGEARFVLEPPGDGDEVVSELAVLRAVAHEADATVLTLEAPLANVYERATVTLRANVIQASHGKTVHDEVLGSSDGSAANQRFRLRQAPLTYLSAPDGSGLESELHVAVAGVTWHEAPFLYGHGREERVYTAHQDHAGRTTITFGDGKTGARLPSTREEVTATYRIGSGEVGNVAAGSLTQIMSGAPGIDAVTNPLPATGGVDPEPAQAIKENMAVSQRATQRIVSLSDYADFCRTFAGIGQAVARTLHTTHGPLLHITVADADGKPLAADSALYTNLLAAIAARRAAPVPRVQIDSYESLYFDVANTLLIARDHLPRVAAIEAEAREVLCRVYGLAGRTLARDVSAAEIISRLQRLAGVVAVEVDTLALHGASGAAAVLPAQPARWDAGAQIARPAQLLIVNPHDGGITIRWEVAP